MASSKPLSLSVSLFGMLLATALPAQPENPKTSPWPAAYGAGSFERIGVGEFTGDDRASAMVLRGGVLYFAYDPAVYEAIAMVDPTLAPITDMVTLVGVGTPRRDRVLVTQIGRPRTIKLEDAAPPTVTPVLSAQWSQAWSLTTRAAGGSEWIAAIADDQQTVLVALQQGGGDPVQLAAFDAGERLTAVQLMDWDDDGTDDVVAITDSQAHVFSLAGVPMQAVSLGMTDVVTAVLEDEPTGDRLACVGEVSRAPYLQVVDRNGSEPLVTIDLSLIQVAGPFTATGLAAADMSDDGDVDLLLSHNSSAYPLVLENGTMQGKPTAFDDRAQIAVLLTPSGDPSLNLCPGVWQDLDFDGLPDALFWFDSSASMALVFHAGSVVLTTATDLVVGAVYDGAALTIDLPPEVIGSATDLRVLVWYQTDPNSNPYITQAHSHQQWSVTQLWNAGVAAYRLTLAMGAQPSAPYWANYDHFYVELRPFNSATEEFGQTQIAGVTMKPSALADDSYEDYMKLTLKGGDHDSDDVLENVPSRPDKIGVIITRKEPPPFLPGTVPNPGPLVVQ